MSYDWIFSPAAGYDSTTYYTQLIRIDNGYFWDANAGAMAAAPTHVNTVIAVTGINSSGSFGWTCPASLPSGYRYKLLFRLQAGEAAANTDNVADAKIFKKHRSGTLLFE